MIKTLKELEAIRDKMAPLMYLRSPHPTYKIVFHYNASTRSLGIDDLISSTINKLTTLNRLDCVVYRLYDEREGDTISVSIIEKDKETLYGNINAQIIDEIIDKHLTKGIILKEFLAVKTAEENV